MRKAKLLTLNDVEINKAVRIVDTEFNRARKLTDEQKKAMIKMYKKGATINEIALAFNCSRTAAHYTVDPQFRAKQIKWSDSNPYKPAKKGSEIMKERAQYKRTLVKFNLI